MPIYNYEKEKDLSQDLFPINTHLCIETSVGLYFVNSADRTKVYSINVSDGTQTQVDVDPSDSSGDNQSRDRDIIAAWHDRANEKIYFVDCDNPDTQFDVWYLDYSGGLGSESATEIGDESFTVVTVIDIFKISTDFFVMMQADGYIQVYTVTSSPFSESARKSLRTYGFFCGGATSFPTGINVIEYILTTTVTGNGTDRGDLSAASFTTGSIASKIYGFVSGFSIISDVIDYFDILLTTGNSLDKGDLTVVRTSCPGVFGKIYGFFCGGEDGGGQTNIIDYINVTTTSGNATDRGDLSAARIGAKGVSGSIYGFSGGGVNGGGGIVNVIDYIDISLTTGNASDRGDLSLGRADIGATFGVTYGFYAGGFIGATRYNVIDYIDLSLTSGNAIDKGDLTLARSTFGGVGISQIYGFYGGGDDGVSVEVNIIDYIDTTTTTGNAADKGDLTAVKLGTSGV